MAVPIEMPATTPGSYVLPVAEFPSVNCGGAGDRARVGTVGCARDEEEIANDVLVELSELGEVEVEVGWGVLGAELAIVLVVVDMTRLTNGRNITCLCVVNATGTAALRGSEIFQVRESKWASLEEAGCRRRNLYRRTLSGPCLNLWKALL